MPSKVHSFQLYFCMLEILVIKYLGGNPRPWLSRRVNGPVCSDLEHAEYKNAGLLASNCLLRTLLSPLFSHFLGSKFQHLHIVEDKLWGAECMSHFSESGVLTNERIRIGTTLTNSWTQGMTLAPHSGSRCVGCGLAVALADWGKVERLQSGVACGPLGLAL